MLKKEFPYYPESLKQNMALLLLWDFFSRYWWTVPIILLVSWFVSQMNEMMIAYPAILWLVVGSAGLINLERRRGVTTSYETLPIPHYLLTRMLWFEGVLLLPLIFLISSFLILPLVWILGGIGLYPTLHNIVMHNFLAVGMSAGYASIWIYIIPNIKEHTITWRTALYFFFLMGFFLVPQNHLIKIEQYDPWGIRLLGLYPILILLSFFFRYHLLPSYVVSRKQSKKTEPRYFRSSFSFWFHFWARQMGMLLLGLLACVGMSVISGLAKGRENIFSGAPFLFMIFLVLMVPALSLAWLFEIRSFRTLPMTAGRLSVFLLSVPVINGLCAGLLCALLFLATGNSSIVWYVLAAGCFSIGLSIILYNVALLFGPIGLAIPPFLLVFSLMSYGYEILYMIPIVGLAISPLLMYQIKYSSAVYRRRTSSFGGNYISGR